MAHFWGFSGTPKSPGSYGHHYAGWIIKQSSMSATLSHFLAFLPENVLPCRGKTFRSGSIDEEITVKDAMTGYDVNLDIKLLFFWQLVC